MWYFATINLPSGLSAWYQTWEKGQPPSIESCVACWEFKIKFEKYNGEKIAQIGSRCCDPRKIYHRNHNWQCPIFSHLMFIQFAFDDDDLTIQESTIKRKTPLTKILIYFSYVIQHNLSSETHWSLRDRYKNSIILVNILHFHVRESCRTIFISKFSAIFKRCWYVLKLVKK